jgi:Xaa-Pro aminopeptidase
MERAGQIVIDALAETTRLIQPGVTLREIATEVERQMTLRGSRAPSFETHVGTYGLADRRDNLDPKTADLPLRSGESVKFDYGAVVDGYCSDFGRTIFCGEPSPTFLDTYNDVLLPAQRAAIEAAVPGARAGDVDLACRKVIEDVGMGEYFIHRTGHCIGLDVHELPYISEEDDTILEEGMTFTIEPSINFPGRFGMRIEDVVVCAPGRGRVLVPASDELVVV